MIGIFLSITYFKVTPIIPDKKLPIIVIAKRIPILAPSLFLINTPTHNPKDNPVNDPTKDNNIISNKLLP